MDFGNIILSVAALVHFVLGILVYSRDRKSSINRSYALLILTIIAWAISIILYRLDQSGHYFWTFFVYMTSPWIAASFLYFSFQFFPKSRLARQNKILIFLLPLFLTMLLAIPGTIVEKTIIMPPSEPPATVFGLDILESRTIIFGPLYPLYGVYFFFYFIWSFINLFRCQRRAEGFIKLQILYIFWGYILAVALAFMTALIMPFLGVFIPLWLGPVFALIIGLTTTYALLKRELKDLKVLATEILVAVIIIIFIAEVILSSSLLNFIFRLATLILIVFFGYLLIRSVLLEVERREMIQILTGRLKEIHQRLKLLDQAKSNFVTIVSHQLRTPISTLKGYLSMLLGGDFGRLSVEQEGILVQNQESIERLSRLINLFLDVSQIEAGRLKLTKEKCDLVNLIQLTANEIKPLVENKGLTLKLNLPAKKVPLNADPGRIRDVLYNLIDNAIKYSDQGQITVKAEVLPREVRVSVKDQGIGIAKEEANKLFSKFVRGGGGAKVNAGGAGLGLFIVKRLTEAHGGRVFVESEGVGKGATFGFVLPVV